MKRMTALTVLIVGLFGAPGFAQDDAAPELSNEEIEQAAEQALEDLSSGDYEKANMADPLRKAFDKRAADALEARDYKKHAETLAAYVGALKEVIQKTDDVSVRTALIDAQLERARFFAKDYPEEHRDVEKARAALDGAEGELTGLTEYLRGTYKDRIADARQTLLGEAGGGPSIETAAPTIQSGDSDDGPKEIILK